MAEDRKEFQRRLKAFKDAFDAENWDKAIKLGEAIRAEFPNSFDADGWNTKNLAGAYNNRGNSYNELKQYERAIEDLNKAIEIEPEDAEAYYNRGDSYNKLKQYERAIQDFDKAIGLKPDYAEAYNNRGNSCDGLKQYERAIEDFDKAIELKPDKEVLTISYYNRGISYNGLKQYERAIADYDKAIELKPDYAEVYNNRGNSYNELKQYEHAIKNFEKTIEIEPENVGAYHNRALAIGRQEAEKATQTIKESYEERLSSITESDEIDEIFKGERSNSKIRLRALRRAGRKASKTLWLKVSLAWLAPFVVYLTLIFLGKIPVENSLFQLLSVSLSALFLSTPFFWHLKRLNHDIRVERHALEDFSRKWLLFRLLGAQPDEELRKQYAAQIIEHLDKRGTPEVLNKLYHPKQAHAQDSQQDSREGLLTSLFSKNLAD